MRTRVASASIAIEQIPYVMRAIGYYPSEHEVQYMQHIHVHCVNAIICNVYIHTVLLIFFLLLINIFLLLLLVSLLLLLLSMFLLPD